MPEPEMPPILVPFVKYFDFQGRANRAEYWQFMALQIGVSIALAVLAAGRPNLLGALWSLAIFVPSIAVGVRRYHDINRTGWWFLFPTAVLVVGFVIAFSMGVESPVPADSQPRSPWDMTPTPALIEMGKRFALALGLYGLSLLVPLIMHLQPGTPGANRFGPSPNGDGAERIASVFDAPEDAFEAAPLPEPEARKPVFDFGPSPAGRSAPPAAAARGLPDVPVARPAPQAPRPPSAPAANGPRPFGRRGL
jgi:uncharacterized membrane protein YhaH (DUF805 family)